jgi:hypothetical protein
MIANMGGSTRPDAASAWRPAALHPIALIAALRGFVAEAEPKPPLPIELKPPEPFPVLKDQLPHECVCRDDGQPR